MEEFKNEAIKMTSKLLDKPYELWETFNDIILTKILNEQTITNYNFKLKLDELPILEYSAENSYTLISTQRIISQFKGNYNEILLSKFKRFGNKYEKQNFNFEDKNNFPKINLIEVIDVNENSLIYEIDSHYPAQFSKLLIMNLASYIKNKRWFWNPSRQA